MSHQTDKSLRIFNIARIGRCVSKQASITVGGKAIPVNHTRGPVGYMAKTSSACTLDLKLYL